MPSILSTVNYLALFQAKGYCKRSDATQLHQLLLGQLYVNLGIQGRGKSTYRGRLTELPYDSRFNPRDGRS